MTGEYDPFVPGPFPVCTRTIEARDALRDRVFPCEIWTPGVEQPANHPLILYSHPSGAHRRAATFLCTHLCSHGYVVAALDHSESVAAELKYRTDEAPEQKAVRVAAVLASRVPDLRFLLHQAPASDRIGLVGHSLGGWTVLATPDVEPRIRAIVALAPGGASNPRPGIIRAKLNFAWGRDVPTLFLVAENDVCLPLEGMYEVFERTPATKQLVILRRADHMHFMDNVEEMHETVRNMTFPEYLAWLPREMRPIAELCSGEQAHLFVRGLTLCHMDAVLKGQEEAQQFLAGDIVTELATRGVDVARAVKPAASPVVATFRDGLNRAHR